MWLHLVTSISDAVVSSLLLSMYGTHKLDARNIAVCIKIKVLYLTQQESWKKPFIYHTKYVGRLASKPNHFSFIRWDYLGGPYWACGRVQLTYAHRFCP